MRQNRNYLKNIKLRNEKDILDYSDFSFFEPN